VAACEDEAALVRRRRRRKRKAGWAGWAKNAEWAGWLLGRKLKKLFQNKIWNLQIILWLRNANTLSGAIGEEAN
jgi:hypothetical protein